MRIGETSDAYGREVYLSGGTDGTRSKKSRRLREEQRRIETQNVRGFSEESRGRWMSAWRRTPVNARPIAWLIQETHVGTVEEAQHLQAEWRRMWGHQYQNNEQELSYWSVDASKTGGVAILLNPCGIGRITPWKPEDWTNRWVGIKLADYLMINIYAPNNRAEREDFFRGLTEKSWPQQDIVLAGDFNCVQSPALDRLGGHRSGRPESAALQELTTVLQLEDALALSVDAESEDDNWEPLDYYTYWGPESASRIDRFYLPAHWARKVQWLEVAEPAASSDHQRVRLHYREEGQRSSSRHRSRTVRYPIRTAHPERVRAELQSELADAKVGQNATAVTWDATAKLCKECIIRIEKRETKRRNEAIHRLNAQNRAHLFTRTELMEVTAEDLREEHLVRLGQTLERTTEQLRWSFKRISTWEKDQSIAEIRQINGAPFTRDMTLPNCFASEWKPIFGILHNAFTGKKLEAEFDSFVQIPLERCLSDEQNHELMKPISSEEVITAIAGLSRHKAAGSDGLNNDFYKDHQALLVEAMVAIGNELLQGGEPPKSFLEGLILPLRKNGDSADAMNFRPISLLQTGYKVITKILATRAQQIMGTPIGDSQQGFVHGRQMMKTVMMMMAMVASAREQPGVAKDKSRLILTLDFRKAYDTVAREFLFLAMRKFGFSPEYVQMIQRLHDGTTARFLINGELSDWQDVVSGIRQGCPLAPLLFLLAVEVLALAIRQDKGIVGIEVPGGTGERHAFSAFVDDSTVFLNEAQQLPRVMAIVERFGQLSGLHVQPAKSHAIFLNTAIVASRYNGIPVLRHGDTIRYLGHAVGTGDLEDINWELRIRSVQRRLATAAQLGMSINNRVQILNVIMLPSVMFTAAVFDMPGWAGDQLRNMQKQFLWYHATTTDSARHKVNPGLLYTPKQAGGVGLVSLAVASKTQRVKQTLLWLIQRRDGYFTAWRAWMWRGTESDQFRITAPKVAAPRAGISRSSKAPGIKQQRILDEWIGNTTRRTLEEQHQYQQQLSKLEEGAISWASKEEWTIELPQESVTRLRAVAEDAGEFWATYSWESNENIQDKVGKPLMRSKFTRIRPCALEDLRICRTAVNTYTMVVPTVDGRMHRQDKMRRWGLAILLSSPVLAIGERLQVHNHLRLRHAGKLKEHYRWAVLTPGRVHGTSTDPQTGVVHELALDQQPDGIHWRTVAMTTPDEYTRQDRQHLRRREKEGGIVFYAHPLVHGVIWSVPETIANKHVVKALKKQPYRQYRGEGPTIAGQIEKLSTMGKTSAWQAAIMQQTPSQLWDHGHALTAYQVWVEYRAATRQLNLFHEARLQDNSCRRLPSCKGEKETIEHIFWGCPTASRCWRKLVSHWMEERWSETQLGVMQKHCASRQAPQLSGMTQRRLRADYSDTEGQLAQQWKRIWHIMCSVCITTLWTQRNRVIFQHEEITLEQSSQEFWAVGIRQLQALGKRERRRPETILQGTWLLLCCAAFEEPPREQSSSKTGLVQPPHQQGEQALLTRLRIYQASRS